VHDHYDVLIIGAGLSGIGAACHLARECPDKRVGILERRQSIGGTWDLFRYPGIRSDSDMATFGYQFRPWNELKTLADGPSIRRYVADTAREYGIENKIQFGLKITRLEWSSQQERWIVTAVNESTGETRIFRSRFLLSCMGYYNHDQGHSPQFPGADDFKGLRIHPQHWPEELDYRGKNVVVVGSGATAVTLVPSMADDAAQVTMLQRSPSYIFSVPGTDKIAGTLRRFLPQNWVHRVARSYNLILQRAIYKTARRWPNLVRNLLLAGVKRQLGKDFDMRHFTPNYMPWDQRLCGVPDGDLFKSIRSGKASVVTDEIETFVHDGIRLKSGRTLEADIIVTATGLQLQFLGGAELVVDGQVRPVGSLMTYKGVLLQDIPNMAMIFGYTNASWTLKSDIAAGYVCRLLKHMDSRKLSVATPRAPAGAAAHGETIVGTLSSGYVRRAADGMPRQGRDLPWRVLHNYERDRPMLLKQPIDDGVLSFKAAPQWSSEPDLVMAAA
jgi:cation diffusion facilitator CzcD-associated flavoprotein CzcO